MLSNQYGYQDEGILTNNESDIIYIMHKHSCKLFFIHLSLTYLMCIGCITNSIHSCIHFITYLHNTTVGNSNKKMKEVIRVDHARVRHLLVSG